MARVLGLSRMGEMRISLCLEEEFDIELSNETMEQVVNVEDIVKYLS
jgi:acyl carrier protein